MDDVTSLQSVIEDAWERRTEFAPASAPATVKAAVEKVIAQLDAGPRSRAASGLRTNG